MKERTEVLLDVAKVLKDFENEENRIDVDAKEKLMPVDEVEEIVQQNDEIRPFDSKFSFVFL